MDTIVVNGITSRQTDGRRPGEKPRVVIVGAGFGGLYAAKSLRGADAEVLVIDRHNYHTFVPLLYEVATAGLEAADIAQPVRAILRAPNIRFHMAEVQGIDLDARVVKTDAGDVDYDYLVVAAGSTTNFFGLRSVEEWALELKDLPQAITLRNHILQSFERAVLTDDPAERERLMTIVVVGGGPTGVETSGALAELKLHVLPRDYPELDLSQSRVILLEAMDHLLDAFPQKLQKSAVRQLDELGDIQSCAHRGRLPTCCGGLICRPESCFSACTLIHAGSSPHRRCQVSPPQGSNERMNGNSRSTN